MAMTRIGSGRRLAVAVGFSAALLAVVGAATVLAAAPTRFPTSNAAVTQPDPRPPLVDPENAHADDGVYATGNLEGRVIGGVPSPGQFAHAFGDFGFDAIPANATIVSVTAEMQFKFAQAGAINLQYSIILFSGNDAYSGTVLSFATGTSDPTTDTVLATAPVAATRSQLLDGALGVEVSASASYGTVEPMLIDYVSVTVTYTVPEPTITVPADITRTATSAAGAVVAFEATATDDQDGSLTPTCTPPSGSLFPVGTTNVTCTVTDSDQNTASASFAVTVLPQGAPVPTLPPTSTVAPTSAEPAGPSGSPLLLVGFGLAALGLALTIGGRGRTIRR